MGDTARTRVALRSHDVITARAAIGSTGLREVLGAVFDVERTGLAAGIAALDGRRTEAVAGYHEAFRLARQVGHTATLADLLLDAVIVLGPEDSDTPGFADEARRIYERIAARAYLDRLDEALRSTPRTPRGTALASDAVRPR